MGGHKTARSDSIVPGVFGRFRSKSRTRLIYSGVSSNTNRSENHRILSSAAGSRGQSEGTADICTAKPRPAQRARFAYRSPTTDHTPGLPQFTIHKKMPCLQLAATFMEPVVCQTRLTTTRCIACARNASRCRFGRDVVGLSCSWVWYSTYKCVCPSRALSGSRFVQQ